MPPTVEVVMADRAQSTPGALEIFEIVVTLTNVRAASAVAVLPLTGPLICRNPDEALTIGILNPGALLHGFVPAVAVTVGGDDSVTRPLESPMRLPLET